MAYNFRLFVESLAFNLKLGLNGIKMNKFLLLLIILPHTLLAASGDYYDPASSFGTNWINPTNVYLEDANRVEYSNADKDNLYITNFSVSVPTNAVIDSLYIRINGQADGDTESKRTVDIALTKNGSGTVGDIIQGVLNPGTDGDITGTGTTNALWNTSWTPAEINASTFGVIINKQSTTTDTLRIDHVQIKVFWTVTISVLVSNSTFAFGAKPLNSWLAPESSIIINDGTGTEAFKGKISLFTTGSENWQINNITNGIDTVRAQWSTTSNTGPWSDISAYNTDFTIAATVEVNDSVNFWFRIETPTTTTSYNQYSSTLTVTAE